MGGLGNNFYLQEMLVFIRQLRLLGLPPSSPYACCDGLGRIPKYHREIYSPPDRILDTMKLRCYEAHLPEQAEDYGAGAPSLDNIIFFI